MSPMQRVAELARHVPEAVYSDPETQNESPQMGTSTHVEGQRD